MQSACEEEVWGKGREDKEDSGENRGKGECKPGWQSPSISFNNSNAQKKKGGGGGGGENILTLPNNLQTLTRIPDEKIYNSHYKKNINRMHKLM